MPVIHLTSAEDTRLACFENLKRRSVGGQPGDDFVVEGRYCVRRLAESSLETLSVLVQAGKEEEMAGWFPAHTNLFTLARDQMDRVIGFAFHRGMLACGRRPSLPSIDRITTDSQVVLAAFGISDRDNLGNLLRTAAGFGIVDVIVDPRTVDVYSRRVVRVSMATVLGLRIFKADDPANDLRRLSEESGFRTLAATIDPTATAIRDFQPDHRPQVLVLGNESSGLESTVVDAATDRVAIPMAKGVDSLNVSIAGAILIYELSS